MCVQRDELLRLTDLNVYEYNREMTRRSRAGAILEEDGLLLYAGSHPSFAVNGAKRTEPRLGAAEVLGRARAFFGGRGHNYCVTVRAHADDGDLEEAVREAGFTLAGDLPVMVLDHPLEDGAALAGAAVRRVTDAEGVRDYAAVMGEAMGSGPHWHEVVRSVFGGPGSLVAPQVAAFVGYRDGLPVSAAMTHVSHGAAGVFWVGTVEAARRRGLGEASTRAAANAGFGLGARIVWLRASPMAESLYRRMGFVELSRHREYATTPAGATDATERPAT